MVTASCMLRRIPEGSGCCFLGDIGAGPGPGLQKEARACVRRPKGGVRGMGEEGPLLSSVLGGPADVSGGGDFTRLVP